MKSFLKLFLTATRKRCFFVLGGWKSS